MIETLLIAFIQGITEFIPVSSSLHIIIFSDFLGIEKNILNSVALHFGSLIALIAYFYNDKNFLLVFKNYKFLFNLFIFSVLPVFLIGFLFYSILSLDLKIGLISVMGTFIFGVILIFTDKLKSNDHSLYSVSRKKLFIIGLFNCLALIPGVSRSASIIIGSRFMGLDFENSIRLSLILSLPVISGAFFLTIIKNLNNSDFAIYEILINVLFSFLISYYSIKIFYKFSSKKGFKVFGLYRIVLSLFLIVYYF